MRPTILLLIGTSSAGKSTLAKRLQDALPAPYLLLGIDDVFRMVPQRWGGGLGGPLSAEGFRYDRTSDPGVVTIRYGAVGEAILKGMHRAVAAFAEAGNNLIVDEMLLDEPVLIDWTRQLGRFQPPAWCRSPPQKQSWSGVSVSASMAVCLGSPEGTSL